MNIDDEKVKLLVKKYQLGRSNAAYREIVDSLSSYIYHFPRKVFAKDNEHASEFYIYLLKHLDSILLKYEDRGCKFTTWFTYVLRSRYSNFVKHKKSLDKNETAELSLHSRVDETGEELIDRIAADDDDNESVKQLIAEINAEVVQVSSERNALIFRIHYIELFVGFIIPAICSYFRVNTKRALEISIEAKKSYLHHKDRALKLQDSISGLSIKIRKYELKGEKEKLQKLKKRKDEYSKIYKKIRLLVPMKFLSKLFELSENMVSKVIIKIRCGLKNSFDFEGV